MSILDGGNLDRIRRYPQAPVPNGAQCPPRGDNGPIATGNSRPPAVLANRTRYLTFKSVTVGEHAIGVLTLLLVEQATASSFNAMPIASPPRQFQRQQPPYPIDSASALGPGLMGINL